MLDTRVADPLQILKSSLNTASTSPSWAMSACHRPFPEFLDRGFKPHPQTTLVSPVRISQSRTVLILKGRIIDSVSLCTPLN